MGSASSGVTPASDATPSPAAWAEPSADALPSPVVEAPSSPSFWLARLIWLSYPNEFSGMATLPRGEGSLGAASCWAFSGSPLPAWTSSANPMPGHMLATSKRESAEAPILARGRECLLLFCGMIAPLRERSRVVLLLHNQVCLDRHRAGRFVYANQAFLQTSELAVFRNRKMTGSGCGPTRGSHRPVGS